SFVSGGASVGFPALIIARRWALVRGPDGKTTVKLSVVSLSHVAASAFATARLRARAAARRSAGTCALLIGGTPSGRRAAERERSRGVVAWLWRGWAGIRREGWRGVECGAVERWAGE